MIFGPFLFIYVVGFFLLMFLVALIEIQVIDRAFTLAGLPPGVAFAALVMSLIGSYINIPIMRLEGGGAVHEAEVVSYYGVRYRPPVRLWEGSTMLAVNVGGAVVPVLSVIYLLAHQPEIIGRAAIATTIVVLVVNRSARPIRGLGIATPMFIPPIVAALAGYILGADHASAVAYISGVLGTLIGADIANIGKLSDMGAPVASIGGAGTFDGIFLTGIVAVLLT